MSEFSGRKACAIVAGGKTRVAPPELRLDNIRPGRASHFLEFSRYAPIAARCLTTSVTYGIKLVCPGRAKDIQDQSPGRLPPSTMAQAYGLDRKRLSKYVQNPASLRDPSFRIT